MYTSSNHQSSETSGLPLSLNTTNEHLNDCEPEVEEAIHFTNEQSQDQSLSEVYEFSLEQEQEQLFQQRYEENYNIPDMFYLQRLKNFLNNLLMIYFQITFR